MEREACPWGTGACFLLPRRLLVALFVVAPIGAAVIVSALLLLGASPQRVFLPGTVVMSALESLGFKVKNPVGVVSTAIFWWAIIVAIWVALRRLLPRS